ncbi:MAG TPA: BatA domain-containing protein, partial [Gemmataceae bacterium]
MTFLAPWVLLGAAAAAIPLALHFFYRARYRPTPWAAMKFLRLSIEQTSRRLKFRELILLVLRVLVLVLLAVALARPASSALTGTGGGESVDAVFLIDTSYSMAARDGGVTRLERAKLAAQKVLDQLPPSSTVRVITFAARANVLGPRSPGNFDQARLILQSIGPTDLATDYLPAFAEAAAALDRGTSPNKEVYLFSDLQALGWEQQPDAVRAACEGLHRRAGLYLVRCGRRSPRN